MKIALIIFVVFLTFLLLLLFLPLTVYLSYEKSFVLKIKFSGITIFDNKNNVKHTSNNKKKKKNKSQENFVTKVYKQKGLLDTVKYFASILSMVLKKLFWVIKHFKFRKFDLRLTVATDDAANTAIQYGGICGLIYPVIAFLETNADFKSKSIDIKTDFDTSQPKFSIAFSVKTKLLFWVISAISIIFNYLKIQRKEREKI